MGKTSAASINKYRKKAYDIISLMIKKGGKEKVKAAAEEEGVSVNRYIIDAIEKKIGGKIEKTS